jgi:hypothetical protein
MSDGYCGPGEYSYWQNALRMGFVPYDQISIGNNPDGTPGDLDAAIRTNATTGKWVVLKVPAGCEGASDHVADAIAYAVNNSDLDDRLAQVQGDDAKWALALDIGLNEVATGTAGHPYVRES